MASEAVNIHASEVIQEKPKRRWQSYIWDTLDKSPEERKFVFKLDCAVLTFASLGYFIKYLDQNNLNNAFLSGMKEDLGLYKNQLNYMQTVWTIGYVLGEIPSNLILTRVRPSIWIPTLEVIWTILTFCLSKCNTAEQIYAVRFFVGLAESGFYPGMQYVIGSWYRGDELAKRSCIFHCAAAIATMFSGYLMAAVYHLGGRGGLHGWQWLFVVDGIISLPIALSGYFLLPDFPENTRAFFLTEEERAFGRKRMALEGRKPKEPYTSTKLKRQYLKASKDPKYAIWQINVYPTTTYGVQVVTTLVYAWTSDTIFRQRRWPAIIIGGTINIICTVSLAVWDIPVGWKWACFIMLGAGFGLSGMIMAWAHEICTKDNEERALVVATMNEMAYVFQAWLPLIVWQQVDAPRYQKGYITATCLSTVMILTALLVRYLHNRQKEQDAIAQTVEHSDSDGSSSPTEVEVGPTKI